MRQSILFLFVIPCIVLAQAGRHPYVSDKPIKEPKLLLEGIISTPDDDLNAAFTADGKSVYFSKNVQNRLGVILESRYVNGKWSKPEVVSFSGQYSDFDPCPTAEGNKLFFCSNRPVPGRKQRDFDIYVVERKGSGWSEPVNLGAPVNTEGNEFYPSVSTDGTIIFSSNRPGGKGAYDIYMALWSGSGYSEPANLGDSINVATSEIDNFLAPDKSYIIFAGYGRQDSFGNGDLYVSHFRNGSWTRARNLGPTINSTEREYCPAVSPDGRYLFWTSFRSFADKPPERPITYDELIRQLRGTLNGAGNVYQIDFSEVGIDRE